MRVNNTYVKSEILPRSKAAAKSRSTFGELMSSCSSKVRSADILTVCNRESAAAESRSAGPASEPSGPVILSGDSVETKLAKLREMAEHSDYTGMTSAEIFTEVWQRYNRAFDGNMAAIKYFGPTKWQKIAYQFLNEYSPSVDRAVRNEIKEKYGLQPGDEGYKECKIKYLGNIRSAALGYGNMSSEEVEAAIIKKYTGKGTMLDFLNMQGELMLSGTLTNKMGYDAEWDYYSQLRSSIREICFPKEYYEGKQISNELFESVLDKPFYPRLFFNSMKDTLINRVTFDGYSYDVKGILLNIIDHFLECL